MGHINDDETPKYTNRLDRTKPAPICSSTPTILLTGIPGERKRSTGQSEDKPILLSVGYAACHWCHVMAHESFENEDTARLMNEYFRQHQSGPRGAPRCRRALHGRGAGADGHGRLADDGLPHARWRAVLRRHLLPAAGPLRHARLSQTVLHARRRPLPDRREDVEKRRQSSATSINAAAAQQLCSSRKV